jgi:hypothetical protein
MGGSRGLLGASAEAPWRCRAWSALDPNANALVPKSIRRTLLNAVDRDASASEHIDGAKVSSSLS